MPKIEFVSHEEFPEDEYTKELVYLCLEDKYRVAYVRKKSQNGGMFWASASIAATRNGRKEYFPAFLQDSNFVERDIKDFLEKRKWEGVHSAQATGAYKPSSMSEVAQHSEIPF